ncbi:unnamed protein product [Plutella xylostella]|uniref:(diamondback moth) hypothetical protein n=1 Tax=Plutella xylostella TaxID=51655 RepID=A0A8S4FQ99_PLUXY|nr:unnamed protein product [Plutella xylostella]
MDNGGQVDVVYTDFEKAFDRVDHAVLLAKLKHLGIHGDLLRWIESYLTRRSQAVVLGGFRSDYISIPTGVPQGFDDGAGGDNEVQRTMLELINQLDGFDPRGNIKVLMATNRPDTLDPALMRPGRLDRKVEFGLPDLEGRAHIFRIHARSMSVERDIRFDLLARLCPNSTGAEIRSVCTEAGMFAIRARRKVATEKDFLEAVNKVIKSYAKFSATPRYMTYN